LAAAYGIGRIGTRFAKSDKERMTIVEKSDKRILNEQIPGSECGISRMREILGMVGMFKGNIGPAAMRNHLRGEKTLNVMIAQSTKELTRYDLFALFYWEMGD
jgi:hypothetical protein